jgi:glucans biosynthesis protein C
MKAKKDESIETMRGIALVLMVAAHVLGANSQEGMRLNDNSFGRYIYMAFMHIRMPLFTVISGYVYSLRPVTNESNLFMFLLGKGRRLLIPLAFISPIQYIFQCYTPGVNNTNDISEIWKVFIFPYSHFWFIQAIFLVFLATSLIDHFSLMSDIKKWFYVLIIASLLFLFADFGEFFSLFRAFYLFPFYSWLWHVPI